MTMNKITEAKLAEILCLAKKRFPEIAGNGSRFEAELRDDGADHIIDVWNGRDFFELKCDDRTCSVSKVEYRREKGFRMPLLWGCSSDIGRPGMDTWGGYYVPKGDVDIEDVFAVDNSRELFEKDIVEMFDEQSAPDEGQDAPFASDPGSTEIADAQMSDLGEADGASPDIEQPNDAVSELPIDIKQPKCNLTMVPSVSNFGIVQEGSESQKEIRFINTGDGACIYQSSLIEDCPNNVCAEPGYGQVSQYFSVVGSLATPSPVRINPGSNISMAIQYAPTVVSPDLEALLSVRFLDEKSGDELVLPDLTSGALTYSPNLMGGSGVSNVSILPDSVDYGVVTIGCYSKTYSTCVYNAGTAPLKITDLEQVGCTPEFHIKNVPALPKTVGTGAPVCFETNYSPADEGSDRCGVRISTSSMSSPNVFIPLTGEGSYETQHTDEFTQVSGKSVDILFVIDDSTLMCEAQDLLIQSYGMLIQNSTAFKNDYHIGIISTNSSDVDEIGKLNRGDISVLPRYITDLTPDGSTAFAGLAKLGCTSQTTDKQLGLAILQNALSAPLSTDYNISCDSDSDCEDDAYLSGTQCKCIDGTLGGFNKGFIRDDAQLEVVALSMRDDQGSVSTSYYVDSLINIKGWANVDMLHFNAIAGPDGGCVSPGGELTAEDAKRYREVVTATNGKFGSVCDSSYETVMNEIGNSAFGLKDQFFMTRLADPATVKVTVNGIQCASGWEFDSPSNSVIFDQEGACMPKEGDNIRVSYKMLCLKG